MNQYMYYIVIPEKALVQIFKKVFQKDSMLNLFTCLYYVKDNVHFGQSIDLE